MSLRVGEIGKIIRVNTNFDLSSNTELTLEFTKPDGTILTKTKTSDGVSAPGVNVTDPDTGDVFEANEYMEYDFASGDLDQAGVWYVEAKYTDGTPKFFIGDSAQFSVLE
jgi:hypothetical protein